MRLNFILPVRLDIRRIGAVKEEGEKLWEMRQGESCKKQVSPPFKQAEFQIMYGRELIPREKF